MPDRHKHLRDYANWYLKDWPIWPAWDGTTAARMGAGSSGVVLHRDGPYQVELVTFAPHHVVKPHSHPNVSCYDIHLAGTGWIRLAGRDLPPRLPIGPPMSRRVPVLAGLVHSGKAGPQGACFLSIQHWHNGEPSFITNDWQDA